MLGIDPSENLLGLSFFSQAGDVRGGPQDSRGEGRREWPASVSPMVTGDRGDPRDREEGKSREGPLC